MKINLFLSLFSLVVGVSQAWHITRFELISLLSPRDQVDGTKIAGLDNTLDDGYHGKARMLEGSEFEKCEADIQTLFNSNDNLSQNVQEFNVALAAEIRFQFDFGATSYIYIDDDAVADLKNECIMAGGTMKKSADESFSLEGDNLCYTNVEIANYVYCVASSEACDVYPIRRPLQKIIADTTGCVAAPAKSYAGGSTSGGDGGGDAILFLIMLLIVGSILSCVYCCVYGCCCCDRAALSQPHNPQCVQMSQLPEGKVFT